MEARGLRFSALVAMRLCGTSCPSLVCGSPTGSRTQCSAAMRPLLLPRCGRTTAQVVLCHTRPSWISGSGLLPRVALKWLWLIGRCVHLCTTGEARGHCSRWRAQVFSLHPNSSSPPLVSQIFGSPPSIYLLTRKLSLRLPPLSAPALTAFGQACFSSSNRGWPLCQLHRDSGSDAFQ